MTRIARFFVTGFWWWALAACSSQAASTGAQDPSETAATATDAGGAPSIASDASPNCADPSASDLAGCTCSGGSRACFTGPASLRGASGCKDGAQPCVASGEFSRWGACTGDVTSCAPPPPTAPDASPGSDAAPPDDAGSAADAAPCDCHPGTWRWCDSPVSCSWGKQACNPDGTWGTCAETSDAPPAGCDDGLYDVQCCVQAGGCCELASFSADGGFTSTSAGACAGIACP